MAKGEWKSASNVVSKKVASKIAARWREGGIYDVKVKKVSGGFQVWERSRGLVKNPRQLLFQSKAAAIKYAREHGARKYSVRKLKRG